MARPPDLSALDAMALAMLRSRLAQHPIFGAAPDNSAHQPTPVPGGSSVVSPAPPPPPPGSVQVPPAYGQSQMVNQDQWNNPATQPRQPGLQPTIPPWMPLNPQPYGYGAAAPPRSPYPPPPAGIPTANPNDIAAQTGLPAPSLTPPAPSMPYGYGEAKPLTHLTKEEGDKVRQYIEYGQNQAKVPGFASQDPEEQQRRIEQLQTEIARIQNNPSSGPGGAPRDIETLRNLQQELAHMQGWEFTPENQDLSLTGQVAQVGGAVMGLMDAPRQWQADKMGNAAYQASQGKGWIDSDSIAGTIGDLLAGIGVTFASSLGALTGQDSADAFINWAQDPKNAAAIQDAYENGFGELRIDTDGNGTPDAVTPRFTGGRAVWELYASTLSPGYKFVYDMAIDPTVWGSLLITAPLARTGEGIVEGARAGEGVLGLGPGTSAAIGYGMQAPEAIIQSPDLLVKGTGKVLTGIGKAAPGGLLNLTPTSQAEIEAEQMGTTTALAMNQVSDTAPASGVAAPPTSAIPGAGPGTGGQQPWAGPGKPSPPNPPPTPKGPGWSPSPPPYTGPLGPGSVIGSTPPSVVPQPSGQLAANTVNRGRPAVAGSGWHRTPTGSFTPSPSTVVPLTPEEEGVKIINRITELSDELSGNPTPERAAEIQAELDALDQRYTELTGTKAPTTTEGQTAAQSLAQGNTSTKPGPKPGALEDTGLPEDLTPPVARVTPVEEAAPTPPVGTAEPAKAPAAEVPTPETPAAPAPNPIQTKPFDYDGWVRTLSAPPGTTETPAQEFVRQLPDTERISIADTITTKEGWRNDLSTGTKTVNNPITGRTTANDTQGGMRMVDELLGNSVLADDQMAGRAAYDAAKASKVAHDAEIANVEAAAQADKARIQSALGTTGKRPPASTLDYPFEAVDKGTKSGMPPIHQQIDSELPGYRHAVNTFEINRDVLGNAPALRPEQYIVASPSDPIRRTLEEAIFGTPEQAENAFKTVAKWSKMSWYQDVQNELTSLRRRVRDTYDPERQASYGMNQEVRTTGQVLSEATGSGDVLAEARRRHQEFAEQFRLPDKNAPDDVQALTPPPVQEQVPAEREAGPPVSDSVSVHDPAFSADLGTKPVTPAKSGIHREADVVTKATKRPAPNPKVQTLRKSKSGTPIGAMRTTPANAPDPRYLVGFQDANGSVMANGGLLVGWSPEHQWFEIVNMNDGKIVEVVEASHSQKSLDAVLKDAAKRVQDGRIASKPGKGWQGNIYALAQGPEQKFSVDQANAGLGMLNRAEATPVNFSQLDPRLQDAWVHGRISTDEAYFLNQPITIEVNGKDVQMSLIELIKSNQKLINPNTGNPYDLLDLATMVTQMSRDQGLSLFSGGRATPLTIIDKTGSKNPVVRWTSKALGGQAQFFRENVLYNPITGVGATSRDMLSNAAMIAGVVDTEAAWRSLGRNMRVLINNWDEKSAIEEFKRTRRALGLGDVEVANLESFANAGITGSNTPIAQRFASAAAQALGADKGSLTERLAQKMGGVLASKGVRDRRVGADVMGRLITHDFQLAHYAGDKRLDFLQSVYQRALQQGKNLQEAEAAVDAVARVGTRINGNTLMTPQEVEDALKAIGWDTGQATHMARVWGNARREADRLAQKDVQDALFSYKQLKIDSMLSNVLIFHYWQTRALRNYAHIFARNPWLVKAAYNMHQWFSETSKNPNLPPWIRGMLKFASLNGYSFYLDPMNVLLPWAAFRTMHNESSDQRDADAWFDLLGVNPMIQAAGSIFNPGGKVQTQHAPNIFGTTAPANLAIAATDLVRNYVLPEWFDDPSHMGVSDNIDLVQKLMDGGVEAINQQLRDWGVPLVDTTEFADLGATRIRRVREIVEDLYMQQHGIALGNLGPQDYLALGEIMKSYGTDHPDPLLVQALQMDTMQNTGRRLANMVSPAPLLSTYDPQYERTAIRQGDQAATSVERENANSLAAISTTGQNDQALTLESQNEAQQALGTPEGRTSVDIYNDIAYADQSKLIGKYGNVMLTIGPYTLDVMQLTAMTDDQRKTLADLWLQDQPGLDTLYQDQYALEKAFKDDHQEYANYQSWQHDGYTYINEKGVDALVDTLSGLSPGYRSYVDHLDEDKRKEPSALLGVDAYLAFSGKMGSIYGEHVSSSPEASMADWMMTVSGFGDGGSGSGKKAPKTTEEKQASKVQDIKDAIAKHDYQQQLYDQVLRGLGYNPDQPVQEWSNSYFGALMGAPNGDDPRLAGVPKPTWGAASDYNKWRTWKLMIDPHADVSIEMFVRETWLDDTGSKTGTIPPESVYAINTDQP